MVRSSGRSATQRASCPVAAWCERAALDVVVEPRWNAGDRHDVVARLEVGCRGPEQARVRMPCLVVERVRRALLDDPAGVHHGCVRAGLGDDRQVMRHEDEREAELVGRLGQELEDLRLHHHVERRRRLVGQENARVARERHRDRRSLAHPAGELVRVAPGPVRRDADRLEELADPRRRLPSRSPGRGAPSARRSARRSAAPGRTRSSRPGRPWRRPLQRCGEIVCSPPASTSAPSSRIRPETEAVGGSSPISARTVVVLPQPDSPTMPSLVPGSIEKETPCTACSVLPFGRSNQTLRSSTSSSAGVMAPAAGPRGERGSAAPRGAPSEGAG